MISLRSSTRTSSNLLRLFPASLRSYAATPPTSQSTALEGQAINRNVVPGATIGGGQLSERETVYPHTRPAPRFTPVVPLGSAPIPGGGRWSGVQTGARSLLLPPPGTPEGQPGEIGLGIYKGTEWDLFKWEISEKGLHWKVPLFMAITMSGVFLLYFNDRYLFGPPAKPAGDYSMEEDKSRDAAYRVRLAEIAAREKAAQLKAEAIAAESLSNKLESAKDEARDKVEDLGESLLSSTSSQLQVLVSLLSVQLPNFGKLILPVLFPWLLQSEKFQNLKSKVA
ncbi:hypothetical protein BDY24DRAFT_388950 [Mrakia frigida]|uniref:uncharacterized protein n=1 Tax=Mrakia frigida TaxID=29902 RepID=UPI003FCC01CD